MNQKYLIYLCAILVSGMSTLSLYPMVKRGVKVPKSLMGITTSRRTIVEGSAPVALANASILWAVKKATVKSLGSIALCVKDKAHWKSLGSVASRVELWALQKESADEKAWRSGQLAAQKEHGIDAWCAMNGVDSKDVHVQTEEKQ